MLTNVNYKGKKETRNWERNERYPGLRLIVLGTIALQRNFLHFPHFSVAAFPSIASLDLLFSSCPRCDCFLSNIKHEHVEHPAGDRPLARYNTPTGLLASSTFWFSFFSFSIFAISICCCFSGASWCRAWWSTALVAFSRFWSDGKCQKPK